MLTMLTHTGTSARASLRTRACAAGPFEEPLNPAQSGSTLVCNKQRRLLVCAALKGQKRKQLYHNVVWSGIDNKWRVVLVVDGKRRQFARFESSQVEAAARLRDKLVLRFWGAYDTAHPLNFPVHEYEDRDWMQMPGLEEFKHRWSSPTRSSRFTGITWRHDVQKWHARVCHQGRQYSAGLHAREEAAARAHDLLAVRLLGSAASATKKLNFPTDLAGYMLLAHGSAPIHRAEPTSLFHGVSYAASSNAWLARLVVRGKVVCNMEFSSAEAAAHAYDNAVMQHLPKECWSKKLNFPQQTIHTAAALA